MKILIADDDLVGRTILEHALHQWKHEVVSVRDGQAAWQILQQDDAPQIAILDWMMPLMDGPELCRLVRSLRRPVPPYMILLTSKNLKRDIVRGLESGADDYIGKPFDVGELRSRLRVGERMVALHERLSDRVRELESALERVRQLEKFVPAGSLCQAVDDADDDGHRSEPLRDGLSAAELSPTICSKCRETDDVAETTISPTTAG